MSQILSDGTQFYIYGQERLYAQAGTTKTWYTSDVLGSVRHTLDSAGSLSAPIRYDPFGNATNGNTPTFGFTGELTDASGYLYLRARRYDPNVGFFTSRDPVMGQAGQPSSFNQYQYAYGAPTMWTDPSGRCVFAGIDTLICGAAAAYTVAEALALLAAAGVAGYALYTSCITNHGCEGFLNALDTALNGPQHTGNPLPPPPPPVGGTSLHPQTIDDWYHGTPLTSDGASCPVTTFPLQPEAEGTHSRVLFYDVSTHSYGRPRHGADEADVRTRVTQVFEWWYDPSSISRTGQALYAGLAGNGPTATIYYNATRNIVNDLIYLPTVLDARAYVNGRGYTQLVASSPIP